MTSAPAFIRTAPEPIFHLHGRSAPPGDADEARIIASMRSFRALTDRARLAATPDRVRVVKAGSTGSFETVIAGFGPQAVDSLESSILNNVEPGDVVRAGELLKLVEPGKR